MGGGELHWGARGPLLSSYQPMRDLHPAPSACPPGRSPCGKGPVALKGLLSSGILGHFSLLWPVLEGVFLLANLGPSKYPAASAGNDRTAGSPRRALRLLQASPLQPQSHGHSQALARPPPRSISAGPAQARAPVNLAGAAFPNACAGPEPLPALDIQGPHPLGSPKNKARRRPAPRPPRGQVSGGPCSASPKPLIMRPRPAGSSRPPLPSPLALGTRGPVLFGGFGLPRSPSRGRLDAEMPPGPPRPPLQPPQQWRAGPQRPGRQPPGREQVREGAAAGSRRRPAPPRPLPAGCTPARPAPALTSFWAAAALPLCFPNQPGKAP